MMRLSRKTTLLILVGMAILIPGGISGWLLWGAVHTPVMPEALQSIQSDARVQVQTTPWITFTPQQEPPSCGFIFYPGGLVPAEAYAPAARAIAEAGYLVVIVPMPLNLAVLNTDAAAEVIETYAEVQTWAVGGHSLGGTMAAAFAAQKPDRVAGLVLWASYPATNNDLSALPLKTVSIYGTSDGLASPTDVLGAGSLLPPDTLWFPIEGGNHAQFGWYGDQNGDLPASIEREAQQAQIVAATLHLLEALSASR